MNSLSNILCTMHIWVGIFQVCSIPLLLMHVTWAEYIRTVKNLTRIFYELFYAIWLKLDVKTVLVSIAYNRRLSKSAI